MLSHVSTTEAQREEPLLRLGQSGDTFWEWSHGTWTHSSRMSSAEVFVQSPVGHTRKNSALVSHLPMSSRILSAGFRGVFMSPRLRVRQAHVLCGIMCTHPEVLLGSVLSVIESPSPPQSLGGRVGLGVFPIISVFCPSWVSFLVGHTPSISWVRDGLDLTCPVWSALNTIPPASGP